VQAGSFFVPDLPGHGRIKDRVESEELRVEIESRQLPTLNTERLKH